mgnify:CR=1 FL=1
MLYLLVGIGAAIIIGISLMAMRHLAPAPNQDWLDLGKERRALEAKLGATIVAYGPSESHEPSCSHPKAVDVWEALAEGKAKQALAIAEEAMAGARENPEARLLLAAALLANGDYAAAGAQVQSSEDMGADGSLVHYLSGRIEIEQYLHSIAGSSGAHGGEALMPAELLALDLHVRLGDSGDATALWMPGQGEVTQEQAREFVLVHFGAYYRILDKLLDITTAEPFGDGLYHVGRLAIKCGFSEDGVELLASLEDSMVGSAYKKDYDRIMATLRGEKPVTKEASLDTGRKVVKLKVLN